MEPLTIGLLAGSIFAGLTGASLAALKGWQGWLELKRFELTHSAGDRTPSARRKPDRGCGSPGTRPQARSDRRRYRHLTPRPLALPSKRRGGPATP